MAGKWAFEGNAGSGPAMMAAVVVPSDSDALPNGVCRSLYVGTAGNVALKTYEGSTLLFKNVPAGSILPVACGQILQANTTAADMVALY